MQFETYFNDYNEMTYKDRSNFIDALVPLLPFTEVKEVPVNDDSVEILIRLKSGVDPIICIRCTKVLLKTFKKRLKLRALKEVENK